MMIVIAHISDSWTGRFMMVVYSTVAYVILQRRMCNCWKSWQTATKILYPSPSFIRSTLQLLLQPKELQLLHPFQSINLATLGSWFRRNSVIKRQCEVFAATKQTSKPQN
ncbi:hypothetical protein ACSBR2_003272 [Camellia fascicularis]